MYTRTCAMNLQTMTENIFDITKNIVTNKINGASIVIPHICHNHNQFSGGLSNQISYLYPAVKANFEVAGKQPLGKTQFIKTIDGFSDQALYIANMVVLDSCANKKKSRIKYDSFIKCITSIKSFVNHLYSQKPQNIQIHIAEKDFPCRPNEFEVICDIMEDFWLNIPIYYHKK